MPRGLPAADASGAVTPTRGGGSLRVYDKRGRVETISLRIKPGTQRVLR